MVVDSTYLGIKGDDPLPISAHCLEANMTVCDAVYIPGGETGLIQLTKELSLRAVPGKRMLLYQGVQAQRMWTGKEPDVAATSDAQS